MDDVVLSSVKLGSLLDLAVKRRVPYAGIKIKDAFLELAERDGSRGGGPLDEVDLVAIGQIIANPTLEDVMGQALGMLRPGVNLRDLSLRLVETSGDYAFSLGIPPSRH
jgi:hypothetical protein